MIALIPFGQDPLAAAACRILDHYTDTLPDLSRCQLLVADTQCAAQLRAALLDQARARGFRALLGPSIERLDSWLEQVTAVERNVLSRPAQELILGEALRNARQLYAHTDPWLLADQLLELFEELTRHQVSIPAELEAFNRRLQTAYGLPEPSPVLQQEAYILHTLWHAWREQLDADNHADAAAAYLERLRRSLSGDTVSDLWLLGFTEFAGAERKWLAAMLHAGRAHLLLHGDAAQTGCHPDAPLQAIVAALDKSACGTAESGPADADAFSGFFRALFAPGDDNLAQRARDFARQIPGDPLRERLHTFTADNPEQEAQAVALQVRRWLVDGQAPVAIVTEDRRLARRVRAMLEASAIQLDDPAGWALSTTSAAAVVERWLESVEEDFACSPLLDVLKSPFVGFDDDRHLHLVRRLEQDIILHENIARGLERYRRHLDLRRERLPDWSEHNHRELHALLNRIDHAAAPLRGLLQGKHPAAAYVDAVIESLQALGAYTALLEDAAGNGVIDTLQQLAGAAAHIDTQLTWQELRNWLGRSLERATFRVPGNDHAVKLLTLEQTRLQRFAGVIVAGCSRRHLPGTPAGQAFFNQRVRAQLGLPTWCDRLAGKLHHFVRVLHSGGRLLLTRHREADGEPVPASPWLELLEAFHANAYSGSLHDDMLQQLLEQPQARPASPDAAPLPGVTRRPEPRLPVGLQPDTWSAYTHQRLIDCPYRFFAADALGLKPLDEIREALSKNDYGALVHRVLQAFHSDLDYLPGPWSGPLKPGDRDRAIALLQTISQAVFGKAIKDNFQARGWLQQWLDCLPGYIDWQIERERGWCLHQVEVDAEHAYPGFRLKGRIDRLDRREGDFGIVDYKTGRTPGRDEVLSGEAVQLPSYALMLDGQVSQLDYLEIGGGEVKSFTAAEADQLQPLLNAVDGRLADLQQALQAQAALPAWGDERICSYCEFSGLCRRDAWSGEDRDG